MIITHLANDSLMHKRSPLFVAHVKQGQDYDLIVKTVLLTPFTSNTYINSQRPILRLRIYEKKTEMIFIA